MLNEKDYHYNVIEFFDDIKRELALILSSKEIFNGKAKNRIISMLFGEKDIHVKAKISDKTEISREQLESYLKNLTNSLKKRGIDLPEKIFQIFERYRNENNLREYTYGSVLKYHPGINLNYFKNINSIEKAYWLGWLYAEGWMSLCLGAGRPYIEWGVGCSKEDDFLIKRFMREIGFNPKYLEYNKKKNFYRIRISFTRMDFPDNLIKLGLNVGKKSHIIKLPDLGNITINRNLYLAFFLGYFDGDGNMGTSEINSASRLFLEKIKNKFNIDKEIRFDKNDEGGVWRLTLGAELFNEMLENYQSSLPRKRIKLEEHVERIERLRNFAQNRQKFLFKKDDLQKLVGIMTYEEIATLHNGIFNVKITPRTVKSWTYKWKIDTPTPSGWVKIYKLGPRSPQELRKIYIDINDLK